MEKDLERRIVIERLKKAGIDDERAKEFDRGDYTGSLQVLSKKD